MKYHITKDNRKILLKDIKLDHLINIIKWIKRKSKEGITVLSGGGSTAEDMWCDEEFYKGKRARKYLKYKYYKKELKRRNAI